MIGVALQVTPEQINKAKRLMTIASLGSIRLVHVRAAHMTAPGCPVKKVAEKEMPTTVASLIEGTNSFRVIFGHAIHGRRGTEGPEVQIDATFEMTYSFPQDAKPTPTTEEMEAFAETNAVMNCWPYWRELVQTTVAKMGLPPLVVPLLRWVSPAPKQEPKPVGSETVSAQPTKAETK